MRKSYDIERLLDVADCREVAINLGLKREGAFYQCPNGNHIEHKHDNCSIKKNFFNCFACQTGGDVFTLVQLYYATHLGQPITWLESVQIVGDMYGGHELFADGHYASAPTLPFKKEEMAAIGLVNAVAKDTIKPIKLDALFMDNKELYYTIIRQRAEEQLGKVDALLERLGKSSLEERLRLELDDRRNVIVKVLKKAGGEASSYDNSQVKKMFDL